MHGSSVVLISLFTSILTATGTAYLVQRYDVFPNTVAPRQVHAPLLVGLSEADARDNASALQIPLLVEGREAVRGAKPGFVVRQSIAPGQAVPDGTGIGVVFAAALPTVPKLAELPMAEARETLARLGFKGVEGAPVNDARVPVGHVVLQLPVAGAELEAGGAVTLHASGGPAEVLAPRLSGLPLAAATEKLESLGLTAKVRWISRAETVTGSVLSQKPEPGTKLQPKGSVEVVVNR